MAFSKTIGDASLLIFSAFKDVYLWSQQLNKNLSSMTGEYPESLEIRGVDFKEDALNEMMADFDMKARRLVHLGEVSYKENVDPLSLAVSQTFKIEKEFSGEKLGCTEAVADAIRPKLRELGVVLTPHKTIRIPGEEKDSMLYYVN